MKKSKNTMHTTNSFFHEFINELRKDIKKIGIITDKDGTILLDDSLRKVLKDFNRKKLGTEVIFIANSGRTVQDMINCLQEENIPVDYFNYIIGDNGGMCLDVRNNTIQYKHVMEKTVVEEAISIFLHSGGKIEDIRLADGKSIYAYPSKDVQKYYQNSKDIIFTQDILNLDEIDITKLTITGSHDLINKVNKKIRDSIKGYKTHIGKTAFPKKERKNYRIDFTRNAHKRRSGKKSKRGIGFGFMYLFRK